MAPDTVPAAAAAIGDTGLPLAAGLGLRPQHMAELLRRGPQALAWIEVHSENFLVDGGPRRAQLEAIAAQVPVSAHGVGLGLGGVQAPSPTHLKRLARLFEWLRPAQTSEHLAWTSDSHGYVNDLLPVPYTAQTLARTVAHVDAAQQALGRRLLIENPSTVVTWTESTMTEWDFLAELAERAGCGLLLDLNNIAVVAHNHGYDPATYLAALPAARVGELHVAGHALIPMATGTLAIDDHGSAPAPAVWTLLSQTLARIGPRPVLLEWDTDVPPLSDLLGHVAVAQRALEAAAAPLPPR